MFIANRLAELGKTQEHVAEKLGRDRSAVSRIAKGDQSLKIDQLPGVAEALELTVAELLEGLGIEVGRPRVDRELLEDCLKTAMGKLRAGALDEVSSAELVAFLYQDEARTPPEGRRERLDTTASKILAFQRR